MMQQLDRDFSTIKLIVTAIYSSIFIYAALVYFGIPSVPYIWEQTQRIMFFALLASVPVIFVVAELLGRNQMSSEKLAKKFSGDGDPESGLAGAIALVRTGTIIMAAMGEACAVLGLVIYFISGNAVYPFVFFALSAIHYLLTVARLNKARKSIEQLLHSHP